jgi:sulfur carrier protein
MIRCPGSCGTPSVLAGDDDSRHPSTRIAMKVKLNGKTEDVSQATVFDLLKARNIEPQMVSVEHNLKILEKDEFAATQLRDGDTIEILYYMGGGG